MFLNIWGFANLVAKFQIIRKQVGWSLKQVHNFAKVVYLKIFSVLQIANNVKEILKLNSNWLFWLFILKMRMKSSSKLVKKNNSIKMWMI